MDTTEVNIKNWKSLIKPPKLDINLSDDKSYAKIIAEPLEKVKLDYIYNKHEDVPIEIVDAIDASNLKPGLDISIPIEFELREISFFHDETPACQAVYKSGTIFTISPLFLIR